MKDLHKAYFAILAFLIVTFTCQTSSSQKSLQGILLRYDQPVQDVVVSIEGFQSSIKSISNEKGEFTINIPKDGKVLEFQMKGANYKTQLKLNPKDTTDFITVNLDKLMGIYSWRIESSLAASSSFFSTYQSSGNNNNISTVLGKALVHLEWKKGEYTWINDFNLLYGQSFAKLRLDDPGGIQAVSVNAKSGDLLSITSSFAQQISKTLHLTALTNFQSQFAPGYSDPYASARGKPLNIISNFLSPATFNLGVGLDYRPNKDLSIYYSPCALDVLAVRIPEIRPQFNLIDKTAAFKFGSFLNLNYRKQIIKNLNFATKLQLFTNYLKNKENPTFERPGSVDVQLWQNSLNFHFNKYFSIAITTTLIYDEDRKFRIFEDDSKLGATTGKLGPRVQYFHNIGLGLNYSFSSKNK